MQFVFEFGRGGAWDETISENAVLLAERVATPFTPCRKVFVPADCDYREDSSASAGINSLRASTVILGRWRHGPRLVS
jgi:hypothetical protein